MSGNFIDTNVVIYSLGNDLEKRKRSIELISDHPVETFARSSKNTPI